jgi:hypothetical protein
MNLLGVWYGYARFLLRIALRPLGPFIGAMSVRVHASPHRRGVGSEEPPRAAAGPGFGGPQVLWFAALLLLPFLLERDRKHAPGAL